MNEVYKLYTDGSHRMLDNMAGFGGHIDTFEGKTILEFSDIIIDKIFFNQFEKLGLKKGLELCLEHGITKLECYADDIQLAKKFNIVEPSRRNIHDKNGIKNELLEDIFKLRDQFEYIKFNYLPRNLNAKADRLSHKEMDRVKSTLQHIVVEGGFNSDKFHFAAKYQDKGEFNNLAAQFTNFIVLNTTQNKDSVNVYHVQKDIINNTTHANLIASHTCLNKITNNIFDILNNTLMQYTHLKDIVIFLEGTKAEELQQILKGQNSPTKKMSQRLEILHNILESYNKVTYHKDKDVIKSTLQPKKEELNIGPKNKEFFLLALTELGKDDYFIGKNPMIENTLEIKNSKKNNITDIQKLYFTAYFKLHLNNARDEYNLPVRKNIKEEMKLVKEHLTNQGIKLRM